jgi:hypothetical protein
MEIIGIAAEKYASSDHPEAIDIHDSRIFLTHATIFDETNSYGCPDWVPQRWTAHGPKPFERLPNS